MKNFVNFILYLIFLGVGFLFRILTYKQAQRLGYLVVLVLSFIVKKYKKIILQNLEFAFPNETKEFYQKIYRENLKHLGRLLADTFLKKRMNKDWFEKHLLKTEETHQIEKEIQEKLQNNEPVILISGHLGTWENLAQYVGYRFYPKAGIIYKAIKNPFLDRWFLKARTLTGARLFEMEEAIVAVRFLQNGNLLGFAADQNAGGAGIMIPFLNRPASTYKGPAFMGTMSHANLYFITMLHKDKGKLLLHYQYLGRIPKSDKQNREYIIEEWTKKWMKSLETFIKIYPEQYFWVHQRWKTTPEIMKYFEEQKLKKRGYLQKKE
ncbi:MAG: lauroyl acyltransferase [Leptospiraceae bacterium]|nr:lauroyl acyltransferase [Leptospiraceae bacterium]MDW7975892.1 lauroyl acyltransferase [Leptospiraceae bacterium]